MSLRSKAIRGTLWSAMEKCSFLGMQFLLQVILARLLTPSDYGIVAILSVFIAVSNTFIDCGFSASLVQNQKRTETDFSTAFYFNVGASLLCYLILFMAAPYIAHFYHLPDLTKIMRIIALSLPLSALGLVNKTRLQIEIDFKKLTLVSLSAVILSGVIGILLAYGGFGVWSLVIQMLLNSFLTTVFLFIVVRWLPAISFSWLSFKNMYNFGIKLLGSSLLDTLYSQMYPLIIGKFFSANNLGLFSRASQFASFPATLFNGIMGRVIFPVLSPIQDDTEKLLLVYRKYIRLAASITIPVHIWVCLCAKPLILMLLGDKWAQAIPLLQILCLDFIFDGPLVVNVNLLYVKGYTNFVFKLNLLKKSIAILILFISFKWGLIGLCWGRVVYSQIAFYLTTYYTKKIIGLGYCSQMKDIMPTTFIAVLSALPIWGITYLPLPYWGQLALAVPVTCGLYVFMAYWFKFEIWEEGILLFNQITQKISTRV